MMTLADVLTVRSQFARSANFERDAESAESLDGYVVTARALDVVGRVADTASGSAGGAWSVTGPYGSGKSSLGLLLDAAFGPPGVARELALDKISEASSAAKEAVLQALSNHQARSHGFYRALVTADREPVARTVLRGLHRAVVRRHGKIPGSAEFPASSVLKLAQRRAGRKEDPVDPSVSELVDIAGCMASRAPLLIVIDEFGKNLEAARDDESSDTYLLQRLAEAGQGTGLSIFVITLQHLSFEEYLADVDDRRRRDWAKVQGRFVDIAFTESAAQTRALIAQAFEVGDDTRPRIDAWAKSHAQELASAGIADLSDPAAIASCWPLHPVSTLVLPELCNRFGQHERTLFSFLAGNESGTVAALASGIDMNAAGELPSIGPEAVYDYFMGTDGAGVSVTGRSSRWMEIASRLRDANGLTDAEQRLAKSVALLNLVSASGAVRASASVLELVDPESSTVLSGLEQRGLVTYRAFADEYRIWQGTDVNVVELTAAAHDRIAGQPLHRVLETVHALEPMVAARHSAQNDTVRLFRRRFAHGDETVEPPGALDTVDGDLLLVTNADGEIPTLSDTALSSFADARSASRREWNLRSKPVVVALPVDVDELDLAAREVAALSDVLATPQVEADWVARREIGERLASARSRLEMAVSSAFSTDACRWKLLDCGEGLSLGPGRGSAPLSEASDLAFPKAPRLPNEMLNRSDLTSQGAKARRLLLEAMIERSNEYRLGFKGYGPEVAMYEAGLKHAGLHRPKRAGGDPVFGKPRIRSNSKATEGLKQIEQIRLAPTWEAIEEAFEAAKKSRLNIRDLYVTLASPPYGVKVGVIPVVVTAALLARADRIAIYEHGTFQLGLSPELSERMVRNPEHFEIKHFANISGRRRDALDVLAARFGIDAGLGGRRVGNVLAVTLYLAGRMRGLEQWTRRTSHLSADALAVRDALNEATEPDVLLFELLPVALGYALIAPGRSDATKRQDSQKGEFEAFADGLARCIDELASRCRVMIAELCDELLASAGERTRLAVSGPAAGLVDEVLDRDMRAFVLALSNDVYDDDLDWMASVATVLAKKAPTEWNDDDLAGLRAELPHRLAAFNRLKALHNERLAIDGVPFDVLRVTFTDPSGAEESRLVQVTQDERRSVELAVSHMLKSIRRTVGSDQRAYHAALTVLGKGLLEPAGSPDIRHAHTPMLARVVGDG
ncbi:MAG: hypothetical protein F4117_07890 [Acidimicrobiales bacterium]|nr:hypothetical protein [Acidimicrobiales bacterium]MYB81377.1 hypothetical protein [Acidimicrobiales bacterium]MYI12470.1 hypothetical protein [Acidimicrobiales bacterium]